MAEDIRQNFGTEQSVTIALDGLANGSSAISDAIDLGNPGPFALALKVELEGASASNTDNCDVFAKFSNDNVKFSADDDTDLLVGTVKMNGAAGVVKLVSVPVFARYVKVRVENNSGDALAAGSPNANELKYVPVSIDQA